MLNLVRDGVETNIGRRTNFLDSCCSHDFGMENGTRVMCDVEDDSKKVKTKNGEPTRSKFVSLGVLLGSDLHRKLKT